MIEDRDGFIERKVQCLKYTREYIQTLNDVKLDLQDLIPFQNKKILITGASGLICSAVVDCLIQLNQKYSLNLMIYAAGRNEEKMKDRFSYWKQGYDYFYCQYDAELPLTGLKEFDYIIHGAGNATPDKYALQPVETITANFTGLHTLLEFCKKQKKGRILYISSSEVYGKKQSGMPYSENDYGYVDVLNPRACYPSSKRMGETLCAAYKKEYGIDFVVVRPGHIYGPTMAEQDTRAASEFAWRVHRGKKIVMKSAGTQIRSYCYVMDCAAAILVVLLKGKSGEAYNISNKKSIVTIHDMAKAFADAADQSVEYDIPTEEERLGYNMMENSSLTSDKLESLGWRGVYDMNEGVFQTLKSL